MKKDGKRLYELGREGLTDEDVEIQTREVQIHRLELIPSADTEDTSHFGLDVECGGGTYIRSLVRDIGIALDTLATMDSLERTKQGPYLPVHCLGEDDWTAQNVYEAIERTSILLQEDEEEEDET